MRDKVIIGISSGVDSAIAALKLKAEGYEVLGCYFAIRPLNIETTQKLKLISEILEIPVDIKFVSKEFDNTVIKYFREEHLAGRSPSPCAICNPIFKWKLLFDEALLHKASFIASGHYVQKTELNKKWYIVKGSDPAKDQSYYLWGLSQEYLDKMIFPLGDIYKTQTKELAKKSGLEFLVKSKESTGLCFTEGISYSELIKKYIPESVTINSGIIIDEKGNEIGKHKGYIYYTIGQKRDLDFFNQSDKCVIDIDAARNIIIAGSPKQLWKKTFTISNCNFIDYEYLLKCKTLSVKIRGFGWNPDGYCKIVQIENDMFQITLDNPAWAPAPGQPAVFYDNTILTGGGIIK